ncbi:tRNA pseudouridine(38-40) synthase TruA [Paenibacillus protaetiae]|uniref:tRNA pseudouridine synthase A n=1 Tax=Paenibacillus protaetiae TaxID=2509456 RepID=A0A4P6EYG5_9BACL|nr:tRNA pseudouridine(38-40) synthase TruA [Paenibacillus protaetiae]QAY67886.1 tRNA pseudouridine(38-40) synthase TruA [Paenibacillus protaetiae]
MRNICMKVSYDGSGYNGFQSQPDGNTVQDKIEKALLMLTGEEILIIGSGRTDAGVHARGQMFNFHTASAIPIERWPVAINSRLPDDIVILEAYEVPENFHARRSAKRKTYRYTIDTGKYPDVFGRQYRFHHYRPLDVAAMRQAIVHLIGTHDYTSFTSTRSTKPSHVRTIYEAYIEEEGPFVHVYVTGNGFLYNMVRIIVGTLIKVGIGAIPPERFPAILQACDRSKAGPTAIPQGLMLWDVHYAEIKPGS